MGDRGQASVEFMLVLGLGMLIILPATLIFFNYSQGSNQELRFGQAVQLGTDLVTQAETVYYYTDPSRLEVQGIMPQDVQSVQIITDWSNDVNLLVLNMRMGEKTQPVTFFSPVNINGTIEAKDAVAGKKRIRLEVRRDPSNVPFVDMDVR